MIIFVVGSESIALMALGLHHGAYTDAAVWLVTAIVITFAETQAEGMNGI